VEGWEKREVEKEEEKRRESEMWVGVRVSLYIHVL